MYVSFGDDHAKRNIALFVVRGVCVCEPISENSSLHVLVSDCWAEAGRGEGCCAVIGFQ